MWDDHAWTMWRPFLPIWRCAHFHRVDERDAKCLRPQPGAEPLHGPTVARETGSKAGAHRGTEHALRYARVMAKRPTNAEIADVLERVAALLEVKHESPYRIRAYRAAAQRVRAHSEQMVDIIEHEGIHGSQTPALRSVGQSPPSSPSWSRRVAFACSNALKRR